MTNFTKKIYEHLQIIFSQDYNEELTHIFKIIKKHEVDRKKIKSQNMVSPFCQGMNEDLTEINSSIDVVGQALRNQFTNLGNLKEFIEESIKNRNDSALGPTGDREKSDLVKFEPSLVVAINIIRDRYNSLMSFKGGINRALGSPLKSIGAADKAIKDCALAWNSLKTSIAEADLDRREIALNKHIAKFIDYENSMEIRLSQQLFSIVIQDNSEAITTTIGNFASIIDLPCKPNFEMEVSLGYRVGSFIGATPLWAASSCGSVKSVTKLLEMQANPFIPGPFGILALEQAITYGIIYSKEAGKEDLAEKYQAIETLLIEAMSKHPNPSYSSEIISEILSKKEYILDRVSRGEIGLRYITRSDISSLGLEEFTLSEPNPEAISELTASFGGIAKASPEDNKIGIFTALSVAEEREREAAAEERERKAAAEEREREAAAEEREREAAAEEREREAAAEEREEVSPDIIHGYPPSSNARNPTNNALFSPIATPDLR